MHRAFKLTINFVSLCLLFLAVIFLIAGGETENYITGGVMLLISLGLLGYIYLTNRIEAKRPIHQEFHVTMGGSGEFKDREIYCKSCGAPVHEKDLTIIKGGIMVKCSYCGKVYAMEEEPKW